MGDSAPANDRRIVVWGVIGVAALIIGYCGVKAVQIGRTVYGVAMHEVGSMRSRMDTTHHVQDGSAVYFDQVSIAPLAKVVIIHADTTPSAPPKTGAESALVVINRHEMLLYTTGAPTDSAAAKRVNAMQSVYGLMRGQYTDTIPVRIDLVQGVFEPSRTMPAGMLTLLGRPKVIPFYPAPTPK